jgi:hypothetical protein
MAAFFGAAMSLSFPVHSGHAGSPGTEGSWATLPYLMPINPIHGGILHTGKVLIVAGSENEPAKHEAGDYTAAVWDTNTGTITVQNVLWDIFCTGMSALPDGRFLIAGGTGQVQPPYGDARCTVFDPLTEKFVQIETMANARFYATATTLSDGRVMVFGGLDEDRAINNTVEFYTVGSGWSPELLAPWTPRLYPRFHVLPDGDVFCSGILTTSHIFHPATNTWSLDVADTVYPSDREGGSSVLLPLRPEEGYAPRILILGGDHPQATATAELIDLSVPSPAWQMTAPMSLPRVRMEAVMLPTGKVLALGGSAMDEDGTTASLAADLFDPDTETWSPAGTEAYARLYHSMAVLLPDATVAVAGSNPVKGTFEQHIEIYSPAYLFTSNGNPAVRPTITGGTIEIGYGAPFSIKTPNSADIGSVVLTRPCSSSHDLDFDQRLIGLSFSESGTQKLTATAPPNAMIAPPGYYMLFILNRAGVPSVAKFVHLTSTPANRAPKGKITSPSTDLTIQAGDSVSFSSTASDPDGTVAKYAWIFPGGTPATSTQQNPGLVTFSQVGTHVVSMTALDNSGVNDPSPPTRTITVPSEGIQVTFVEPTDGSSVSGNSVPIVISATGTVEAQNTFTIAIDGKTVGTTTTSESTVTFTWFTRHYAKGPHTLTGTVSDDEGNSGSTTITVTLL